MPAAIADAAPKKGNKKLLVIIAVAVALSLAAGAAVLLTMKNKAVAEAEADEDGDQAPVRVTRHDPKAVPTFVPLETFTVNLADRDAERYAQVGMTLEVAGPNIADQIKAYMPAIRNNVLMALADKTAAELTSRDGKSELAEQVRRETARAMGYEVAEPVADDAAEAKGKSKKKKAAVELPVTAVHFSNFIIQ